MKLATSALLLASWIIYPLSFIVPKNPKIWIFIGWHKNKEREIFADNAKYLFLHVTHNCPDIRAVWIGADKKISALLRAAGYESWSIDSWSGIYYSLRAGYTIIDAVMKTINWRYSGGSRTVQLWHADGLKKLDLAPVRSWSHWRQVLLEPSRLKRFGLFISSSRYMAQKFVGPSFGASENQIKITGLPRYDAFFRTEAGMAIDQHEELKQKMAAARAGGARRLIFYAPTFRRGQAADSPLRQLNLPALDQFLADRNDFLFISLHPKFSTANWRPDGELKRVFFINPDFDKYPLLPNFDLVITDYSSICLEFLLLDKPTIFYVYDLDDYRHNPGLPEEFWQLVPF